MEEFDALILAGGAGRRLAGADKAVLDVGGVRLLDRAIEAVAAAHQIVVVGPWRPTEPTTGDIVFTREQPAGSGPAAALMHGLTRVDSPIVVVIAVDVPFAAPAVARVLRVLRDRSDCDAAMVVDSGGRRQPLLAAYRTQALKCRAGDWANRAVRALVGGLSIVEVPAQLLEALDCDTPDDLRRARQAAESGVSSGAAAPPPSRRTPRTPPAR
jgi:molybdopterin-guanine dinucleotide biosynthesis protein A